MRAVRTPDKELVEQARRGAAGSFEELFERHREAVARTVYLVVGDSDTAQDLTQEAFGIGWKDLTRLRDPGRFRGWVTGIALNLARRRWRVREIPFASVRGSVLRTEVEETLTVRAAVKALPIATRVVVVLRYYADLGEDEIALALGIPVGTVKSRLSRARRRLAKRLQDGG